MASKLVVRDWQCLQCGVIADILGIEAHLKLTGHTLVVPMEEESI